MADLPRTTLKMRKGDENSFAVTVRDSAGTVVNLTGLSSLTWVVTTGADDSVALISLSVGDGLTVTDAVNGLVTISIVESRTTSLAAGYYHHKMVAQDAAGVTQTVLRGTYHLENA